MLQVFRKFFHSSVGVFSALALIGLIAMAFAAGDVANMASSAGITGGDRVATVGSNAIGTAKVVARAQQALESVRAQTPGVTMKAFVAEGGLNQVLDQMIDDEAQSAFGAKHGVIAGKRLVDSELAKIPAFQGAGGKFDESAYRQLLAQRQLTDADVRESIAHELISRQLLSPAKTGASLPQIALAQYAGLLKEHRVGAIGALPSAAFAPKVPATQAEIAAWYGAHLSAYQQPERRVIRYALFDDSKASATAPTDSEIAARYQANAAQYAASENRKISQLIVISQSLATDIAAQIAKGASLEDAAKAKGLTVASLGSVSKADLATKSGAAVAEAAFAAKAGATTAPAKSTLGWAIARVDAIDSKPARSLDSVKGEIAAALLADKRKAALAALTQKIDDRFGKGGAISDAAKELGLSVSETAPITVDGQIFGQAGTVPKELTPILKAAFSLEHEGQAQISELVAGKSYAIFTVGKIEPAAPAPLNTITARVANDIALSKGAQAAKAAALKMLAAAKKGGDLAALFAGVGTPVPPVQQVNMGRDQIAAMQGRIPPAIGLFFGMAQGTTKLQPLPNNQGWLVVQLKQIIPGQVDAKDPILGQIGTELAQLGAREHSDSLRRAIRAEIKVSRHDAGLKTVTSQLVGGN
jgi:peptidyl-prolyl cis-trans isomerase D